MKEIHVDDKETVLHENNIIGAPIVVGVWSRSALRKPTLKFLPIKHWQGDDYRPIAESLVSVSFPRFKVDKSSKPPIVFV